jgi:hypothetical protein
VLCPEFFCYIVEVLNGTNNFRINFTKTEAEQSKVKDGFKEKYFAKFACCAGAIDGSLILIHKPPEEVHADNK